jgi:hypothetical protein
MFRHHARIEWVPWCLTLVGACSTHGDAHHPATTDADASTENTHQLDGSVQFDAHASQAARDAMMHPLAADAASDATGLGPSVQLVRPGRQRLSVNSLHVCALNADRDVVCWGQDSDNHRAEHVALRGPFVSVDMTSDGDFFDSVCAIRDVGGLACALWDGTDASSFVNYEQCTAQEPGIAFAGEPHFGFSAAFIDADGRVFTQSNTSCSRHPIPTTTARAVQVEIAEGHVCSVDEASQLSCSGSADDGGRPIEAVPQDDYIDVAVDSVAGCAVTRAGKVRCWDYKGNENVEKDGFAAAFASSPFKVIQLASNGEEELCALLENGHVGCSNIFERVAPQRIDLGANQQWVELAVGSSVVCGIDVNRKVECAPFVTVCGSGDCSALTQQFVAPTDFVAAE